MSTDFSMSFALGGLSILFLFVILPGALQLLEKRRTRLSPSKIKGETEK